MSGKRAIKLFGDSYAIIPLALTVVVGLIGGLTASVIGAPLPWLLGAVVAIGTAAGLGLRPGGASLQFPVKLRIYFVPIIGVSIGGQFTPALMLEFTTWWPTLALLVLYVPLAHAVGYAIYRWAGRYDPVTAYFSAIPGGLIESIAMGEEAGADARALTLIQFSRIVVCVLVIPLIFMAVEGMPVGSAAGMQLDRVSGAPGLLDAAVLIAAGVLGFWGARRIGFPAAIITGPIAVSGVVHLVGLTAAQPPWVLILITQAVIGMALGVRFVGLARHEILHGLGRAVVSVMAVLGLALAAGVILYQFVGESIEAVVLAYAPGGVVEMSLIALSLHISVVFVTTHHVVRIILAVILAKLGHALFFRSRATSVS